MSLSARCPMKTSRVAQAEARAGGRGARAWRKIVISYPKRRPRGPASDACSTPVKYHHSLRNAGWGPSSAGNTNGRGASASAKPSFTAAAAPIRAAAAPGAPESSAETESDGPDPPGDDDDDEEEDDDRGPAPHPSAT